MAGTRRSTRQSATSTPKYADPDSSVSEDEAPSRKGKKATRRKRVREDEDDVKGDDDCSPKKPAKPQPNPSNTTATTLEPSSPSNRSPNGSQEIYWLLKAEPLPRYENGTNVSFSIDDLAVCTQPEPWTGVRNPLACKNMRAMRKGDLGFFYHSNAKPSGVVGILRVVEEAKVDETAFDEKDPYYDKKSERGRERWWVRKGEWDFILGLAGEKGVDGVEEKKKKKKKKEEGDKKDAVAQDGDVADEAE
ncbi:hypothetical protein GRF29_28g1760779 [Pseudopithomyces chartarum]|uniref:EVE domain-containing protein n=1 Tax=Pseudopithomyces chartarum TaxID=1892770 RepID=A0AAN6M2E3_9PLEO|nr:hypothetical protein GRF29_28g1760779 [Pseudopithomyces chartarum]